MNKQQGLLETAKRSITYLLLLVWGVGAFCLLSIFSFDSSSDQALISSQIIEKVLAAENLLLEVESSQRGYLYTGREDYLVDFTKKAELVSQILVEAEELSRRPEQKNRIALLSRTAGEKIDETKRTIQLARANQNPEARVVVLSDVGKSLMTEIAEKAQAIIEVESSFVDGSWARVNKAILALKIVVVSGIVAIGLFNYFWYAEVRRRLEPLAACVKRAKAITMNQIPRDLLPVEKEDEVGSLTHSINEMTQALARSAGQVDQARIKVASLAGSLAKRAVEQTAAISQLSAAIQEITATIKDMNLSATQMSENAKDSVDEAKSREKAGVDGLDAVDRSLQATKSVTRQVDQVASITLELNQKATRIERIVFFVNELTERSNILSINAALLASNSDGNRDSFSVLADEMQKLTSRSKSATLEIHETLQDIRGEIQRVVLATEETSKQVEFGNDAASQASESIKVLKRAVDQGNDTFLQVVAAVRQQNHALAQVEQALAAMRESAELVEEESHRLRTDASRLSELNQTLESSELLKAVRS